MVHVCRCLCEVPACESPTRTANSDESCDGDGPGECAGEADNGLWRDDGAFFFSQDMQRNAAPPISCGGFSLCACPANPHNAPHHAHNHHHYDCCRDCSFSWRSAHRPHKLQLRLGLTQLLSTTTTAACATTARMDSTALAAATAATQPPTTITITEAVAPVAAAIPVCNRYRCLRQTSCLPRPPLLLGNDCCHCYCRCHCY